MHFTSAATRTVEAKSQHFLLSKEARSLSTKRIHRLSDEEAYAEFVAVRFAENGGRPMCPWCGHREAYAIPTRQKWKCTARTCRRQFSATSGTIFAWRKLPFGDLLLMVAHLANALVGISALRLSRELEVSYKTGFVRYHKLREVLETHQQANYLRGQVEIDGGYFGGYVRPKNHRPKRVDRRRLVHQSGRRQCVVIFRERNGLSRPLICSESEAATLTPSVVEPGSIVFTDENNDFSQLAGRYDLRMINHSERYSDGESCTNWAESYFARMRHAERGVHFRIAGPHLAEYANEMSWREDRRRYSNLENFEELLRLATHHPVSRKWKGYWQRRKVAA